MCDNQYTQIYYCLSSSKLKCFHHVLWEGERVHKKETSSTNETKSENQWNKNDVTQFTEQINQKTDRTRMM
jgi:hypothetical protein